MVAAAPKPRVKIGRQWMALDMTEPNKLPGWEYKGFQAKRDFDL